MASGGGRPWVFPSLPFFFCSILQFDRFRAISVWALPLSPMLFTGPVLQSHHDMGSSGEDPRFPSWSEEGRQRETIPSPPDVGLGPVRFGLVETVPSSHLPLPSPSPLS